MRTGRIPILYIGAEVDAGESAKGSIDWFRQIDRERWAASLITIQPSANRAMREVEPFAEEIWDLPDLMPGGSFPEFILGYIESRGTRLVHISGARLAFDLLPDMASLPQPPAVVAQLEAEAPDKPSFARYAARRYGNLIDAFSTPSERVKETVVSHEIAPSRIEVLPEGQGLGSFHDELYERLLAARPASARSKGDELFGGRELVDEEVRSTAPLTFPRDPVPARTVGVIVPCYRHGIFLDACIRSIKAQTLPPEKIVVVDDGSDDPETVEALARWEGDPEITVIRLPVNGGPSIARNRGLDELETSYVLSIDADDELLPDALERMLAQLEAAPANVGFIYPHAQHTGNRTDYVQLPAYNTWLLMKDNYCPAPALFDRRVFEAGVEYPEDIVVGHEDWDLILQLAEREVHGLHADGPTFLYRKQGFSRVNAVEYGPHSFHESIERRHPDLYQNADRIKADWAPALSILLLDEGGAWSGADLPDLGGQTCRDFEVLAKSALAEGVRQVAAAGDSPGEWLQAAIDAARGRWVCVLGVSAAPTLRYTSFVEQLLYGFRAHEMTLAIALADATDVARHTFAQLDDAERLSARPVGVAFERVTASRFPLITLADGGSALTGLAVGLQANGLVQWRKASVTKGAGAKRDATKAVSPVRLDLNERPPSDKSEAAMRNMVFHQPPRLPELTPDTVRRWKELEGWIPSGAQLLCRHVDFNEIGRIVSNNRQPPLGYRLEFDLGATQTFAAPGMRRLVYADNSFELSDDQNDLDEGRAGLGYVEEQPLPMLVPLELRRMPETDRHVLVAGPEDPLFEVAEPVAELGWIEAFPIEPRKATVHHGAWGVTTLRRLVDRGAWRHTYLAGGGAEVADSVVLGSLYPGPDEGLVALRQRGDDRLASDGAQPGRASRDPRRIGRWITGSSGSEASASPDKRLRHLTRHFNDRRQAADDGQALGWLRREDAPGCTALFSTTHPVTADQLVTRFAQSAMDRGYLVDGVLGYILVAGADGEAREASRMAPW